MDYRSFGFHICEEEFIQKHTSLQMGKHKSEAHQLQRSQLLDGSQITVLHAKVYIVYEHNCNKSHFIPQTLYLTLTLTVRRTNSL